MINNHESTVATRHVIESIKKTESKLEPIILPATVPNTIAEDIDSLGLTGIDWTYPVRPEQDGCLLYTSPSPRDGLLSRMPSSA